MWLERKRDPPGGRLQSRRWGVDAARGWRSCEIISHSQQLLGAQRTFAHPSRWAPNDPLWWARWPLPLHRGGDRGSEGHPARDQRSQDWNPDFLRPPPGSLHMGCFEQSGVRMWDLELGGGGGLRGEWEDVTNTEWSRTSVSRWARS